MIASGLSVESLPFPAREALGGNLDVHVHVLEHPGSLHDPP